MSLSWLEKTLFFPRKIIFYTKSFTLSLSLYVFCISMLMSQGFQWKNSAAKQYKTIVINKESTQSYNTFKFSRIHSWFFMTSCFTEVIMTLINIVRNEMLLRHTKTTSPWFYFFESESIRSWSYITDSNITNVSLNQSLIIILWYNLKSNSYSKVSTLVKTYLRNYPNACVFDLRVNSF